MPIRAMTVFFKKTRLVLYMLLFSGVFNDNLQRRRKISLLLFFNFISTVVYLTVIEPNQKADEVPSSGPVSGVCNSTACVGLGKCTCMSLIE